jgi:hypothetical protein
MVFADSAARTTALSGVLAEGMMSYLQDTNAVEVYNGTAWVGVSGAGDVTEVQAGTGISVASGTGPIPVVTNSMATEIDAKGDLVVGTGADTFARLAVGTNGHTLVADSVEATGLKWVAPAGGGKVLQVIQATTTTETVISSASYTDSTLSATITPSSATSQVLAIVSGSIRIRRSSGSFTFVGQVRLLRDATVAQERLNIAQLEIDTSATENNISANTPLAFTYLDSPATTSAITYKIQGALSSATGTLTFQYDSSAASIILMEIGA